MTDGPDYASMAALIDELEETTDQLRELAEDVPAVERNADRIEAVVRVLRMNVPPELADD